MIPVCEFSNLRERDMDMLIMEEFVCNKSFRRIFLDKLNFEEVNVDGAYHSLADGNGESDLTFVVRVNGTQIGILVEDKIDAPTMTEQSERYNKRGEDGRRLGKYKEFYVFLVCPREYWQEHKTDKNAQYKHIVFYEELRDCLSSSQDIRSQYKAGMIEQALNAKKKGYQLVENDAVTKFWRDMQAFCEKRFPSLYMSYDGRAKGSSSSWVYFKTPLEKVWIIYKSNPGEIRLEYNGAQDSRLQEKLEAHKDADMEICKVGKAFGLVLHKASWSISFKENFHEFEERITEILVQVERLVEVVKKVGFIESNAER